MDSNLLLQSFSLHPKLTLKNRIVMAPMTRNMADDNLSPNSLMTEYYARRADAGLIISEGTIIRADARGFSNVPGIFSPVHIEGWKRVTDAVHLRSGCMFLQIWHVGRVSHPHFLDGQMPLSASETMMTGKVSRSPQLTYGSSRAASLDDIKGLITSFANAASNAIQAGFDGVEIHGANGYLIDQFLHFHTNHRTDDYGQTPQNMARFALEVVEACVQSIGPEKVGIRLSPGAYLNEIVGDERDAKVFQYLLEQLTRLKIAYVHTGNFNDQVRFKELDNLTMTQFIRMHYTGNVIACGSFDIHSAQQNILDSDFDLLAIGRPFIANPDLIERIRKNEALRSYDTSLLTTLY